MPELSGVGDVENQTGVARNFKLRRTIPDNHRRSAMHRLEDGQRKFLIRRERDKRSYTAGIRTEGLWPRAGP